jgi:hypothetical protein
MSKPIDALLQKEMSRKEFLATLGFGLASVMGFSTLLHLLTGKSFSSQLEHHQSEVNSGYGSSVYGGNKD